MTEPVTEDLAYWRDRALCAEDELDEYVWRFEEADKREARLRRQLDDAHGRLCQLRDRVRDALDRI